MNRSNRIRWVGAIALLIIILLTLIAAPNNNDLATGSTYNRAPVGYGAWYAFMQQQKTPIQRWQKPFSSLDQIKQPITLLRVNSKPGLASIDGKEKEWLEKGNTLVVLGVNQPVTTAAFSTLQSSTVGSIKIDTRRRYKQIGKNILLGDRFGGVVWRERIGKGQAIFVTTPYLAANAYQDYPNNFKYLAQIVSQFSQPVWVDEYIHGYKDADAKTTAERDWLSYLAQTPLFPTLLQAGVLLLVAIWAHNRRFGSAIALTTPIIDNSTAYIEALAGVLQKAQSSDFVVDTIGKAEQLQLQQALGLGQIAVDHPTLIQAWVQQTGRSSTELEQLLQLEAIKRRLSDKELLIWLEKWKTIRGYVKPV